MRTLEDVYESLLKESIQDKHKLKAIVLAGSPYAGKSYISNKIISDIPEARTINYDKFMEFHGQDLLAKQNTMSQAGLYINSMLPLIIDTTSADLNRLYVRLAVLKQFGYDIALCIVYAPWKKVEQRMKTRKRKVPEEIVKKYYDRIYNPKFMKEFARMFESKNIFRVINTKFYNTDIEISLRGIKRFFNSPVDNSEGQAILKELEDSNGKYISDTSKFSLDEIKQTTQLWFKS